MPASMVAIVGFSSLINRQVSRLDHMLWHARPPMVTITPLIHCVVCANSPNYPQCRLNKGLTSPRNLLWKGSESWISRTLLPDHIARCCFPITAHESLSWRRRVETWDADGVRHSQAGCPASSSD